MALPVSAEFTTAVNAKARRFFPKIRVNYTDVFLDPTITASSTDQAYCFDSSAKNDRLQQVANGRIDMTQKWFSLDQSFTLGDAYHVCPDTNATVAANEFGWWTNTLSDGSSNFVSPVVVNITYSTRGVSGYFIAGDVKRGEYPVDFTVKLYAGAVLQFTDTVTGNSLTKYQATFTQVNSITKAELSISKWSHPNRNAKIAEFTTQVIEEYSGNAICGLNVIEEREISNDNSIPVGNIASAQANFCLINNQNRQFDANNTTSRLYNLVKPNVRVDIFLGVQTSTGIEEVPIFGGWTEGWSVPEQSKKAETSARDRLDLLRQTKITTSTVQTNKNFYEWFEIVFADAGLANTEYNIDTTLQGSDYIVPYGWFERVTHRSALETLAQGASCVVYQDRYGLIQVKLLQNFPSSVEATYDRSDYAEKDNQPIYQNVVNRINVTTSPVVKTTGQQVYLTNSTDPEAINASATTTYSIKYTDAPIDNHSVAIQNIVPAGSGLNITAQTHYSWGSEITVQNTNPANQTFEFNITGSTFAVDGQKTITKFDQTSINENGEQEFNYPENLFLQKGVLADNIATDLLAGFKNPQRDLTVRVLNGNPALEMGDLINITDLYTTLGYNIVSNEYSFNGGLQVTHKGRIVT